jgi:hypothetical protein
LLLERSELPTQELVELLHGGARTQNRRDYRSRGRSHGEKIHRSLRERCEGWERNYEPGHYRDLLVSFSGSLLLTGRHGSAEVGYIDPTVLTGASPNVTRSKRAQAALRRSCSCPKRSLCQSSPISLCPEAQTDPNGLGHSPVLEQTERGRIKRRSAARRFVSMRTFILRLKL